MILKKGTVVKHGTTLDRFEKIVESGGLIPGSKRNKIREEQEMKPAIPGIYVAQNLSYYGALAAFTSVMQEQIMSGETTGSIPVVLQIKLGEDCELVADEDYLGIPDDIRDDYVFSLEELKEGGQKTWRKYASGAIIRKIPIDWVINLEHPVVKKMSVIEQHDNLLKTLIIDLDLMVLAYWQTQNIATIEEFEMVLKKYWSNRPFNRKFSCVINKPVQNLSQVENLKACFEEDEMMRYSYSIWQLITHIMEKSKLRYR